MIIKTLILTSLEKAIKHLLATDPLNQKKLQGLQGHTVKVELLKIDQHFFIHCTDEGEIQLSSVSNTEPDIVISGTPSALFNIARDKNRSIYKSEVKITGDLGLGEAIKDIFSQIHIDWEEGIARYTGDELAYFIGKGLKSLGSCLKKTAANIKEQYREYKKEP